MLRIRRSIISFTVDVVVNWYVDELGKIKEKKIQLRFLDSMRFMASSLDSLSSNLVGVSGMFCNECGGSCEFTHINKEYVSHGNCRNCYSGYSKHQLSVNSIFDDFDNLRVNHNDEQFRLPLRKGVYLYEYMSSWDKFEETNCLLRKCFIVTLT